MNWTLILEFLEVVTFKSLFSIENIFFFLHFNDPHSTNAIHYFFIIIFEVLYYNSLKIFLPF
jgi:hypothetical protein